MRFNYEKLPHMDSNSSSLTNLYMSTKLKKLSCYRKLILSLEKSTVICPIPKSSANGFNFVFFFFLEESSLYWTRTRWCILLILAGRWIALSSRPTWSTSKHQDSQSCTETVSRFHTTKVNSLTVTWAVLLLAVCLRLALNSQQSSCFSLPSVGSTNYTYLKQFFQ